MIPLVIVDHVVRIQEASIEGILEHYAFVLDGFLDERRERIEALGAIKYQKVWEEEIAGDKPLKQEPQIKDRDQQILEPENPECSRFAAWKLENGFIGLD